ncbi:3-ketoacyl-ACP reductase [Frateuria sp. Soil773]|uniref:SDR family oxidoreductase n=1 Tax=Frateuria sp. Soil773 TaxID=1736407 RepID=UPI0006FA8AB6|nr:SDR family oxidoreductase [Frateuria sp. Soil773]KRE89162.1 3-ketoacyl-ACP reductase [Frateuria sp. Soil773]
MEKDLDGRNALVTGSSRGIGRAIAEALAMRGAAVAVNYRENERAALDVVGAIASKGGKAVAIKADVAVMEDIYRMFDEAEAGIGPLDIVVASAATAIIKPALEVTLEDYDRTFDTNVRGAFFTLQQAAARVRDNGRIIAISTGGTRMWFAETSLYLGSKGAVEQFVRSLSRELGSRNVTVNAVLPGFTDTDLLPERDRAVAAQMSPFGRIGEPSEVAALAAFLASPAAGWITGQNIGAGGGVM